MTVTLWTPIWFQVEGRSHSAKLNELPGSDFFDLLEAIKAKKPVDITCDADALTLFAKKETDVEYIILDNNIFKKYCQTDFSKLVQIFEISDENPIKVTLPEMIVSKLIEVDPKAEMMQLIRSPGKIPEQHQIINERPHATIPLSIQAPQAPTSFNAHVTYDVVWRLILDWFITEKKV